jgi:hypothetical protein
MLPERAIPKGFGLWSEEFQINVWIFLGFVISARVSHTKIAVP